MPSFRFSISERRKGLDVPDLPCSVLGRKGLSAPGFLVSVSECRKGLDVPKVAGSVLECRKGLNVAGFLSPGSVQGIRLDVSDLPCSVLGCRNELNILTFVCSGCFCSHGWGRWGEYVLVRFLNNRANLDNLDNMLENFLYPILL